MCILAAGATSLAVPSAPSSSAPGVPADWATRVASGEMLFVEDDARLPGFKPGSVWGRQAQVGNGVVGTIVDSGVLYMSGLFNSVATATNPDDAQPFGEGSRSHLARIPSSMAVRLSAAPQGAGAAGAPGEVIACGLEIRVRRCLTPPTPTHARAHTHTPFPRCRRARKCWWRRARYAASTTLRPLRCVHYAASARAAELTWALALLSPATMLLPLLGSRRPGRTTAAPVWRCRPPAPRRWSSGGTFTG